jgi:hypothetical protein
MLELLAAATVAAAPPLQAEPAREMPNAYRVPAGCRNMPYHVVDRFGRPVLAPLGSLPTPTLQLLVDRRIGGCPVITVARGWPPPTRDQPNPPPGQHRVQPLRPK